MRFGWSCGNRREGMEIFRTVMEDRGFGRQNYETFGDFDVDCGGADFRRARGSGGAVADAWDAFA